METIEGGILIRGSHCAVMLRLELIIPFGRSPMLLDIQIEFTREMSLKSL